jgi:hypothetical protein
MGVFWRGIPFFLLERSAFTLGPEAVAIETGTYLGDSAELLGGFFSSVWSIERDSALYKGACQRFADNPRIQIVEGTSREKLADIVPPNGVPALFWLDAHYSGGITAGEDDPCPLLAEINVVRSARDPRETIVLIDDARALVGEFDWPLVGDVVMAFGDEWAVTAIDDVLICSNRRAVEYLVSAPQGSSRLFDLEKLGGDWQALELVTLFSRPIQLFKRSRRALKAYVVLVPRMLLERFVNKHK